MKNKEVVIVTGSSGFIGSSVCKQLKNNYQIIGIDHEEPKHKIEGVIYYTFDITSHEDIAQTINEIKAQHGSCINSVVHLVAYYSFSGEEDPRYQKITVDGTKNLLNELRSHFQVEQFIFSSSMLVYAPSKNGERINEDSPVAPAWPYPQSKVEAEKVLKEIHGGVKVVNLRISGVYDDYCHSPTISQQIIRINEMWATSVPFPGNPDNGQSFLHLQDLVSAIELLIAKRKQLKPFETFVLGEQELLSFRDLQKQIGALLHKRPWPVVRVPAFVAKTGSVLMEKMPFMREPFIKPWMIKHSDDHYPLDIGRIKRILNWAPERSLEETLPKMIKNLKRDPDTWYEINKAKKPFYRSLTMVRSEQEGNQWLALFFSIFLGIWLIANPSTYGDEGFYETWSEVISGALVVLVGSLALIPTLRWLRWIVASIGAWVMFMPLLFNTPSAAAYSNDTLIGALIMLASVYTPSAARKDDSYIPPGWTYNPSTAGQRVPIMFLAFLGFIFSRYLASYQLGHIDNVWDPFFSDGTARVLNSGVSKAFPVSDAGLGAFTYLLDVIAASIGGKDRWKSTPWAVVLFGFMIIPAGATSIVLIMLQPISVGAWCTLCLVTAFIMLIMVPPALDEVIASVQFLRRAKKQGQPFWRTFWLGSDEGEHISYVPDTKPKGSVLHLAACTLLGVWLMFAPAVLSIKGAASTNIYIVAALITTFAVISFSEVGRILRLLLIPLALWLGVSAWFFGEMSEVAQWHSAIVAFIIAALSLPRGRKAEKFGSADYIAHWTPLRR